MRGLRAVECDLSACGTVELEALVCVSVTACAAGLVFTISQFRRFYTAEVVLPHPLNFRDILRVEKKSLSPTLESRDVVSPRAVCVVALGSNLQRPSPTLQFVVLNLSQRCRSRIDCMRNRQPHQPRRTATCPIRLSRHRRR